MNSDEPYEYNEELIEENESEIRKRMDFHDPQLLKRDRIYAVLGCVLAVVGLATHCAFNFFIICFGGLCSLAGAILSWILWFKNKDMNSGLKLFGMIIGTITVLLDVLFVAVLGISLYQQLT